MEGGSYKKFSYKFPTLVMAVGGHVQAAGHFLMAILTGTMLHKVLVALMGILTGAMLINVLVTCWAL